MLASAGSLARTLGLTSTPQRPATKRFLTMPSSILLRCALIAALLVGTSYVNAANQVFKCVVNGSVTFQNSPCPVEKQTRHPTKDELNAERKKRLAEQAAQTASAPRANPPSAIPSSGSELPAPARHPERTQAFRCDGRTHCSQMRSCSEAKYFLANCPNVKMDGNHDGTPCEQQWCTHPFAK